MKKGRFRFIVLSMSMALLGLMFLQAYLIKHDFDIKARQFDGTVMMAMNRMVEQIEQNEALRMVVKNFISVEDSTSVYNQIDDSLMQILSTIATEPPLPPEPPFPVPGLDKELEKRIEAARDRKRNRIPDEMQSFRNMDSSIDIRIEKDVRKREVIDVKVHENHMAYDSVLHMAEQRMQTKMKKLNSMMQKLTFQIVDPSESIFDRISQRALDSIIRSEMKNRDLDLDFKYGIYKQKGPDMVYLYPQTDSLQVLNSPYKLTLFPNDVFKRNEILSITFPDKLNFLLSSILPLLVFSILFTGIIIWGFAYTLKVVLKQKKLADIKSDFINNMTHEFKTPIATIAIANETLRDPRVNRSEEKIDFYTGIIRDENQRMLRQVETVLQMAQIDKGEIRLKKETLDLRELLESAISSMKLTIEQRAGKMNLYWDTDTVRVDADPNHLMNVFINLLDNANKYSPESPQIDIHVRRDGDRVLISIADKGIGMSREVVKRIFDTFFRATSGNIHDVKGFGLGLSYVKAILDIHQGDISVESEPSKGSTFTVSLPILNP
ncbi:MAG: HAMP domain-containing histidine kinase [Bacteroidia bacterium]|nr:HAMP domain-containing histidine kinase [Bacteroidia bacterium]